jgi:hypothetical protein
MCGRPIDWHQRWGWRRAAGATTSSSRRRHHRRQPLPGQRWQQQRRRRREPRRLTGRDHTRRPASLQQPVASCLAAADAAAAIAAGDDEIFYPREPAGVGSRPVQALRQFYTRGDFNRRCQGPRRSWRPAPQTPRCLWDWQSGPAFGWVVYSKTSRRTWVGTCRQSRFSLPLAACSPPRSAR